MIANTGKLLDLMNYSTKCLFLLHKIPGRIAFCCLSLCSIILLSACSTAINLESPPSEVNQEFTVQLLGINDFHGQTLPIGDQAGMLNLSEHLLSAIESTNEHTFILHGGDHVGASPAESALLQDEPAIDFLNIIQSHCNAHRDGTCHIIGTAGNHEFDEGSDEMLRLFDGGNHINGPFLHASWRGSNYQTLSANVVDRQTQSLLLAPYTIYEVNNVPIGFIGITLESTPQLVIPGMVDNLEFKNQSAIVAYYTDELRKQGVESIVVIIHDGSESESYLGATRQEAFIPSDSRFFSFLKALPDAIDVVVTGHSHQFTNAYVTNATGKTILLTQAYASGRAYADISITINPATSDIIAATAEIITTFENKANVLSASASATLNEIKNLITASTQFAEAYTSTVVNEYAPTDNEIPLGQFIADSHKFALKSDFAVMNDGGVRAQLNPGEVTWGQLFAIQPFGNSLVVRRYTGAQLLTLRGSRVYWNSGTVSNAEGQLSSFGEAILVGNEYTVGGNNFIMNNDAFSVGVLVSNSGSDIDETVNYIKALPKPFSLMDIPAHTH